MAYRRILLGFFLSACIAVSAFSPDAQVNSNSVLIALLDSRYTAMAELVEKALLLQTLEVAVNKHGVTIFAPKNEAFEQDMNPELKRFLLEPRNLKSLQKVLMFHVLPKQVRSENWTQSSIKHSTLALDHLHLKTEASGKKLVDSAEVVRFDDAILPDGVIHGIDRVLVPRSVFENFNKRRNLKSVMAVRPEGAPPIATKNHPSFTSTTAAKPPQPPAASAPVLPLGDAMPPSLIQAPAPAPGPSGDQHIFNGEEQVNDFIQTLIHYGGYNEMADILVNLTSLAAEMGRLVSEGYELTVLAPNDEAMGKLTADQLSDSGAPEQIIYHHVIPKYNTEENMYNAVRRFGRVKYDTLSEDKVVAQEADGSVKFGYGSSSAYLLDPDIYTDGRISVQGIDGVLMLPKPEAELTKPPSKPVKIAPRPRRGRLMEITCSLFGGLGFSSCN